MGKKHGKKKKKVQLAGTSLAVQGLNSPLGGAGTEVRARVPELRSHVHVPFKHSPQAAVKGPA